VLVDGLEQLAALRPAPSLLAREPAPAGSS
jgi:hypothetical protein